MPMLRKVVGPALALGILSLGLSAPPAYSDAPASAPTISVQPTSGPVGSAVTVRASCGGQSQIVFGRSGAMGDASALAYESASVRYVIPESVGEPGSPVTSGSYQFGVTCPQPGTALGFTNVFASFLVTGGPSPTQFVGMAPTPDGGGYWLARSNGGVSAFGDAHFFGSLVGSGVVPAAPIVGIAASSDGQGYWLVGTDGGVFAFGDAGYYGSLPGIGVEPAGPVIGIASTADGRGYWLVGTDGGVFALGDAPYCNVQLPTASAALAQGGLSGTVPSVAIAQYPGSVGYATGTAAGAAIVTPLPGNTCEEHGRDEPFASTGVSDNLLGLFGMVTGMAVSPRGAHLWLVGADGGVFAPQVSPPETPPPGTVSQAPFFGSLPSLGITPNAPIVGIGATPDGGGYWLLGADGGVFTFGDATFFGSAA